MKTFDIWVSKKFTLPDSVNLWYFKPRFVLTEFIIWNIQGLHIGFRSIGERKSKFVTKTQNFKFSKISLQMNTPKTLMSQSVRTLSSFIKDEIVPRIPWYIKELERIAIYIPLISGNSICFLPPVWSLIERRGKNWSNMVFLQVQSYTGLLYTQWIRSRCNIRLVFIHCNLEL